MNLFHNRYLSFLICTTIFFSTNLLFGQDQKIESIDLNKDGINDRFEYYLKGKLTHVSEDRNGDQKIDFTTILDDKVYYKIELQDANYDGKIERKKSYFLLPKDKTRIITEVDKNLDGDFEIRYEEVLENIQKQDTCSTEVSEKARDFTKTLLTTVSKLDKGLLPTGFGYKVDHECYSKWGDDFNEVVKDVAVGGLHCLMELGVKNQKGKRISGATRNARKIKKLMKDDGISLICSENTDFNWSGTRAHASTSSADKIEAKNISHPFVSLNPKFPEQEPANREKEITSIKATIFHETLHNLGYMHGSDIEYSYTCGTCCFDKEADAILREKACEICTGNYTNETDLNYTKDFLQFSKMIYQGDRGAVAVQKYMKENKKSTRGIAMLASAQSNIFNPVGSELGKLILSNNKRLTKEDKMYLVEAGEHDNLEEFKVASTSSKALASSLYELYYNKNGPKALEALEKNKLAIKEELKKMKNSSDTDIHDELKYVLNGLIFEMWINNYPRGAQSRKTSFKAYKLKKFLEN